MFQLAALCLPCDKTDPSNLSTLQAIPSPGAGQPGLLLGTPANKLLHCSTLLLTEPPTSLCRRRRACWGRWSTSWVTPIASWHPRCATRAAFVAMFADSTW